VESVEGMTRLELEEAFRKILERYGLDSFELFNAVKDLSAVVPERLEPPRRPQ
jgi:hypothetical protein